MPILIRKFRPSDAHEFHAAVLESVENMEQWLPWATAQYSIENAVEWTSSAEQAWNEGSDYRFIIEQADTGQILGSVGFNQIVPQHKIGNLGYWVRTSALNQGVCTKAATQAVVFAFRELGLRRIEIHVLPENKPSNLVAQKLGAEFEGTFRNKVLVQGVSLPANCYSLIPTDIAT